MILCKTSAKRLSTNGAQESGRSTTKETLVPRSGLKKAEREGELNCYSEGRRNTSLPCLGLLLRGRPK